jgi:hypothetical protein
MQICWPWIFGKRRHSGEMSVKSQLISHIFLVLLRHCLCLLGLTDKKIKQTAQENACAVRKLLAGCAIRQKVDQMVKIYNFETENMRKSDNFR